MANKPLSLYIHIPFCSSICSYCDFSKVQYREDFEMPYLKALQKEIESYKIEQLETIYIGGGTPTSLSDDGFSFLFEILKPYIKNIKEFTVEANPESLSKKKIEIMKQNKVNRVSIGVESTDDEILKLMNRKHTFFDVCTCVSLLKENGIDNINLDLMMGLPNQSIEMIKNDIDKMLSLNPKHISIYSLTVHPHTVFGNKHIKELSDDKAREQIDFVSIYLIEKGFNHYEISNFALNGYESIHNKVYWKDERYYGVGLGASGYIDDIRYTNTKSLNDYINGINIIKEKEEVSFKDDIEYFLMLYLRLEEGFSDLSFKERFGFSFIKENKEKLDSLYKKGLLIIKENNIIPTYEGRMLLDRLLLELL